MNRYIKESRECEYLRTLNHPGVSVFCLGGGGGGREVILGFIYGWMDKSVDRVVRRRLGTNREILLMTMTMTMTDGRTEFVWFWFCRKGGE